MRVAEVYRDGDVAGTSAPEDRITLDGGKVTTVPDSMGELVFGNVRDKMAGASLGITDAEVFDEALFWTNGYIRVREMPADEGAEA